MREKLRELTEEEGSQRWLYFTEDDIKGLPCFQNETLIAIKAPRGTTLEVPNPYEASDHPQMRYRIVIRSTMGSIDIFLVSKFEEKMEEVVGIATPPRHTDVVKPASIEGFRAAEARHCSRPKHMLPHVQHIQKTPDLHSQDFGGMTKITPDADTDADYWLQTDGDVSITDMWRTAPEVEWNQFLAEKESTPHALNKTAGRCG